MQIKEPAKKFSIQNGILKMARTFLLTVIFRSIIQSMSVHQLQELLS